jgi:hypothetical protein
MVKKVASSLSKSVTSGKQQVIVLLGIFIAVIIVGVYVVRRYKKNESVEVESESDSDSDESSDSDSERPARQRKRDVSCKTCNVGVNMESFK